MLIRDAASTNFIVFDVTQLMLEPMIYCTRGEHTNHNATDAVVYNFEVKQKKITQGSIFWNVELEEHDSYI